MAGSGGQAQEPPMAGSGAADGRLRAADGSLGAAAGRPPGGRRRQAHAGPGVRTIAPANPQSFGCFRFFLLTLGKFFRWHPSQAQHLRLKNIRWSFQ